MILFFLIFLVKLDAKSVSQSFSIRQLQKQQFITLNKFGSSGIVNYKISAKLTNIPQEYEGKEYFVRFEIFQQDRWKEAQEKNECNRQQFANRVVTAKVGAQQNDENVPLEGQLQYGKFHNVWIVVLNNCQHELDKAISRNNRNTKLEVTVHLQDENGQEFSLEETGILGIETFMTIITIIGFYYAFRLFKKEYDKYGEFDYAFLAVLIILGLEALQNTFQFIHLLVYNSNGRGIGAFAVISDIIQIIDNYCLMILLILIAWGWTIEFMEIEDWDLYGPLAFLIAFAQALIVGLGKLVSNITQFHVYEGWVGYSISVIYLLLAIYFYYSTIQRKKKGEIIDNFYLQLKIYGIIFFLVFPILLFISKLVDPYKSYKVVILGNMAARMLSIILLSRLFIGKNTDYQKICIKGKSFLDRGKVL